MDLMDKAPTIELAKSPNVDSGGSSGYHSSGTDTSLEMKTNDVGAFMLQNITEVPVSKVEVPHIATSTNPPYPTPKPDYEMSAIERLQAQITNSSVSNRPKQKPEVKPKPKKPEIKPKPKLSSGGLNTRRRDKISPEADTSSVPYRDPQFYGTFQENLNVSNLPRSTNSYDQRNYNQINDIKTNPYSAHNSSHHSPAHPVSHNRSNTSVTAPSFSWKNDAFVLALNREEFRFQDKRTTEL